jgi:hypothetical protein
MKNCLQHAAKPNATREQDRLHDPITSRTAPSGRTLGAIISMKRHIKILTGSFFFLLGIFLFVNEGCSSKKQTKVEIRGKSIEFITHLLGKPTDQREFILSDNLYEFERGLLFFFPEPNGKNIHIYALYWKGKKEETIVWFYKIKNIWTSFDYLIWSEDVKF